MKLYLFSDKLTVNLIFYIKMILKNTFTKIILPNKKHSIKLTEY